MQQPKTRKQPPLPRDRHGERPRRAFSVTGLAPVVREHFERQAAKQRRSLSWLIADIVSDAIGVDCTTGEPRANYRPRKAARSNRR